MRRSAPRDLIAYDPATWAEEVLVPASALVPPGAAEPLAPEASLMFAKFSPDSSRAGYVRAQNVYVEDLASGRMTQVTLDGGGDIINGTSDWVNQEEFGIRDGFRWSPDTL